MNIQFLLIATALVAGVVLRLFPVLWRVPADGSVERNVVNTAVLRNQLAELERDRDSGMLTPENYEEAKRELHRRVLEETGTLPITVQRTYRAKGAAVALAAVLPLAAFTLYALTGTPNALQSGTQRPPPVSRADIEAMVATLEGKLQRNPGDPNGWIMLARSYRVMGRHEDAAAAFSRAGKAIDDNPQVLAEYAETLAINSDGNLSGKPTELAEKALRLEPTHAFSLALAGSAAFARADYAAAIDYWQRLHAQLPPGSDEARTIEDGIQQARAAKKVPGEPPR
jgi:cytochrome c-type biogenesis protein CcmH